MQIREDVKEEIAVGWNRSLLLAGYRLRHMGAERRNFGIDISTPRQAASYVNDSPGSYPYTNGGKWQVGMTLPSNLVLDDHRTL
jgi:hypothetical protein